MQIDKAQAETPELVAYYKDTPQMWRNVALISLCNVAWGQVGLIVMPLMALRLLEHNVAEGSQALIMSINSFAVAFLVMYFSWRSDHTVNRFGRRKPYLFLSAPFIIICTVAFPFVDNAVSLIILFIVQLLFMDMKSSTFPLLSIDCVRREMLGRAQSMLNIANGLVGFIAMQGAAWISAHGDWLPYAIGGGMMLLTTASSLWIKEPPIQNTATHGFHPLSAIRVGLRDRRLLWLIIGVSLIFSFQLMFNLWTWLWSRTSLNLDRAEILNALSWCSLLNIAMAYPVGWLIDRWGGFRVVIVFYVLQLLAFAFVFQVHDKSSLTLFAMMMVVSQPLYQAADMMVYKRCDPKEVGSITSTNSFFRNVYIGIFSAMTGTIIEITNRNYLLAFCLGIVMTTVGLMFFFVYRKAMLARNEAGYGSIVSRDLEVVGDDARPC